MGILSDIFNGVASAVRNVGRGINSILDDVVGLDPNGQGIYQSALFKPFDDFLGIDPGNGGFFSFLRSKGLNVTFADFNSIVTQAVKAAIINTSIGSLQPTVSFDIKGVKFNTSYDLLQSKVSFGAQDTNFDFSYTLPKVGKPNTSTGSVGKILVGGQGSSTYIVNSLYDVVVETSKVSNEIDTIISNVHVTLPEYVENLTLTNHLQAINGNGNYHANTIIGSNSANIIQAFGGDDVINGLGGNDLIYGGEGNDLVNGGEGVDTMYGGLGDDIFIIDSSSDVVIEFSGEGHDSIRSSATVRLSGNVEDLTLLGSASINGYGNDAANVMSGNDASNAMYGGGGNDMVFGLGGNDYLFGEAGNDSLYGGAGTDWLVGGLGGDNLIGEGGADRFGYNGFWESTLAGGNDYIGFFNILEGDRIQIPVKPNALFNVGSVTGTSLQNALSVMYGDVNRSLIGTQPLGSNQGAVFSYGSRSYLTVNDNTQAFNSATDLLIDITGHSSFSSGFSIAVTSVFV